MYNPKQFDQKKTEPLLALMQENSFATLISVSEGIPFVNHLPILVERSAEDSISLVGHMARGNPQWRHFQSGQEVSVVFHGPHTYVTPSWYKDPMNVPTWNYAVVHAYGVPTLIESPDGIESILKKTVQKFESTEAQPWDYNLPSDFTGELVQMIVGFEIRVDRLEGKFKLSQNRSREDYQGVLTGLSKRNDEMSKKVLELMQEDSLSSK